MLIIAMMAALGGHWAVLQSVAWTTMLIDHAKSERLTAALSDTFDGNHPCPLCKSIQKGRDSEKKQDVQVEASKITLFYEAGSITLIQPRTYWNQYAPDLFAGNLPQQPLLEPPRDSRV